MAEIKEFVVNDRRKFTPEGDLRPDAPPSEPKPPRPESIKPTPPPPDEFNSSARLTGPQAVPDKPAPSDLPLEASVDDPVDTGEAEHQLPPLTAEQTDQALRAYDATVDRLDTAIRAGNPGMDPIPEMSLERFIQSLYMQAIMQLGGATEPGQQPKVDLLGARQTIDMLAVIEAKTAGNLTENEAKLIQSALFEMRMGFLEVTQALARQGAPKQPPTPGGGPSIVR